MDVRVIVGKNLRERRLALGLSQEALAHEAGITPSFLSQIENGKRNPTIVTVSMLAAALDMQVGDLFTAVQKPAKGLPRGRRTAKR